MSVSWPPFHPCEEPQPPHVEHARMEGVMHLRSRWATERPTISGAQPTADQLNDYGR